MPALPDPAEMVAKLEEAAVPSVAPAAPALPNSDSSAAQTQFSVEMNRENVCAWMVRNGFEMLTNTFNHFSGTDMLRLTRQDLVSMCGLPNGTRLYYALRSKPAIRLVMFINVPGKSHYNAVYLNVASTAELALKLAALLKVNQIAVADLYLSGPNGIHVVITDELLGNINNEASFSLQILKDDAADRCCLLLRPTTA